MSARRPRVSGSSGDRRRDRGRGRSRGRSSAGRGPSPRGRWRRRRPAGPVRRPRGRRRARAPPRSTPRPAAASPAISRLMPFMSRLGKSSASLRGSVSSSASMPWIAPGRRSPRPPCTRASAAPARPGRSAGSTVRAASASMRVRIRRPPDGHRGHAAHPHRGAARHRVAQVGLGAIEQRHGMAEAPGQRRGDGGRHEAPARRCGSESSSAARSSARAAAVWPPRLAAWSAVRTSASAASSSGAVAAAARCHARRSASRLVVEHGGERLVRRAALGEAGGVVDGRAQQRMAEAQPRSPRRSAARRARRRRGRRAPRRCARRPAAASRPRRCRRPPPAGASAARRPPSGSTRAMKAPLDALGQRQVEAQRRAAGALVVGERARQLEQGERVAAGDAPRVVAHDRGQGAVEQRAGLGAAQPGELQLGQPGRLEAPRVAVARPMSTAIGSACRRRATKTSASADAPSSQWASSTTHSSGCASAAAVSRLKHGHGDEEAVLDALGGQPEGAAQGGGSARRAARRRGRGSATAAGAGRRRAARTRPRRRRR